MNGNTPIIRADIHTNKHNLEEIKNKVKVKKRNTIWKELEIKIHFDGFIICIHSEMTTSADGAHLAGGDNGLCGEVFHFLGSRSQIRCCQGGRGESLKQTCLKSESGKSESEKAKVKKWKWKKSMG